MPDDPAATRGLIKICGLNDPDAFDAAVDAGADLLGLVFVSSSPRFVSNEDAAALAARPRGGAALVGLFQDAALSDIEEALEAAPLDMIQLHGRETPERTAQVAEAFGLPVVQAVGVAGRGDLYEAARSPAALMIYDAKPPSGAAAGGGHGAPFDWAVLDAAPPKPWLLAGGLTPETVGAAVAACRSYRGFAGVDVSSGVERHRGVKDPAAITRFAAAARAAMGGPKQETTHG